MPLVRITLPKRFSEEDKENVSASVHQALIQHFNIPEKDFFHIIEEMEDGRIKFPEDYLGIKHNPDIVFVQIIAAQGRTTEQKQNLYAAIAANIAAKTMVEKANIIITLLENTKSDWSFGNGENQHFSHV
ncbi:MULTISPECIES: tautomerase family protein [Chitinophagaceae]